MRILNRKRKGSIHIMLSQLFLILFIVVLVILTYNNYSLLLMDNYADDALTDALLAAGTVNIEEYGRQAQVILSDTLRAVRSDKQNAGVSQQTAVQKAYDSQSDILKTYLTDQAGFISWEYPEYIFSYQVSGQDTQSTARLIQNYGVDKTKFDQQYKYSILNQTDQNYNKIQYQTFRNQDNGGQFDQTWVQSQELDNAFLAFVKSLQSQEQLQTGYSTATNKTLAKSYENFLTTFGWDFGLQEVIQGGTKAMSYKNFKYTGGRLGELTTINSGTSWYKSPIYIDYITVFNTYKHYLTTSNREYIYYPNKTADGTLFIKVGEYDYVLDNSNGLAEKIYQLCKKNSLNGMPIYDKIIVTKTTIQRTGQAGATEVRYNALSENHQGAQDVVIQQVDYLDPQVFLFDRNGKAYIDSQYSGYINQLCQQTVTVFGGNTSENVKPTVGITMKAAQYPQFNGGNSVVSRSIAKSYPNKTLLTYSITQNQNRGENKSLTNNKQNIVVFNQAVMAQIEFDVQVMNQDSLLTNGKNDVNTAFYQRIVDIAIQPDSVKQIKPPTITW